MRGPSRSEVDAIWQRLIDGALTREQVHASTVPWVEGEEEVDDSIAMDGLYYLHGFDWSHAPDDDRRRYHGDGPGRVYFRSMDDVAAELVLWRARGRDYDADPHAYRQGQFAALYNNLIQEGKLSEAEFVGRLLKEWEGLSHR